MDPIARIADAVRVHCEAIQRTARATAAPGDASWDAMLAHYGVLRLPDAERRQIAEAMRIARGAVPAEVRMLLVALQAWAHRELTTLRVDPSSVEASALVRRLGELVDDELAAYERAVVPAAPPTAPAAVQAPSLGSIFANAHRTSKEAPWRQAPVAEAVTLQCVHCGGPQERPRDFMCRYCRRPIVG